MSRYIDADKLSEMIKARAETLVEGKEAFYYIANWLNKLPPANVPEVMHYKECPKCVYEYDGEVTEYCVQGPCPNFKTVEQIKAEAYKEFAKTVKDKWFNKDYYSPDVDFDDFVVLLVVYLS